MMEVDVVVVGAGISGLTAAYHIHNTDKNIRIAVLEAKSKVLHFLSLMNENET